MNEVVSVRVRHLWNNLVWNGDTIVGQMGLCGVIGKTETATALVNCPNCKKIMANGGKHSEGRPPMLTIDASDLITPGDFLHVSPHVVPAATNVFEQPKQTPHLGHDNCNLQIKMCDGFAHPHVSHDWGMRGQIYHCEGVVE